ncbi:hypothetical protein [Flammeovirga sp. SubArs3]|uniref:hypothetical protein n=1 Tax=Flammeovirga sp. SubArs3 TaxID=2995316 RepID=UPI00248D019B|nr:hypothetical protein [Flammeovirga sp. SubArs3]
MNFLLLKSGGDYIEDMYKKGYLRFTHINKFRKYEKDKAKRNDRREGNLTNYQLKYIEILHPTTEKIILRGDIDMPDFNGQINNQETSKNLYICSLSIIEINQENPDEPQLVSLSSTIKQFGKRNILIYRMDIFYEELKRLQIEGLDIEGKKVEYYNHKTYDGDLSYFHKEIEYKYQKEYRLVIYSTEDLGETFDLSIPNFDSFSGLDINLKIKTV